MSDARRPDPAAKSSETAQTIERKLDRVDELVSLLVDEAITDDQISELSDLLERDADVRTRYVANIQLHCDLVDYFRLKAGATGDAAAPTPVLGSLGGETPLQPPSATDSGS